MGTSMTGHARRVTHSNRSLAGMSVLKAARAAIHGGESASRRPSKTTGYGEHHRGEGGSLADQVRIADHLHFLRNRQGSPARETPLPVHPFVTIPPYTLYPGAHD